MGKIVSMVIDIIVKKGGSYALNFCVATFGAFMGRFFYETAEEWLDRRQAKKMEQADRNQDWLNSQLK